MYSSRRYHTALPTPLRIPVTLQSLMIRIDEIDVPLSRRRTGGSGLGAIAQLVERTPVTFEGWNCDSKGKSRGGAEIRKLVKREGGGRIAGKVWESIKYVSRHSSLLLREPSSPRQIAKLISPTAIDAYSLATPI